MQFFNTSSFFLSLTSAYVALLKIFFSRWLMTPLTNKPSWVFQSIFLTIWHSILLETLPSFDFTNITFYLSYTSVSVDCLSWASFWPHRWTPLSLPLCSSKAGLITHFWPHSPLNYSCACTALSKKSLLECLIVLFVLVILSCSNKIP